MQTSGPLIDVNNILKSTTVSMRGTFAKLISCLLITTRTLDPIELAISRAEVSNLPSLSYNTLHRGVPTPDEIFVIQPLSPWNTHG